MPSVATAMLVDMVGVAGGLELAILVGGAVLGVLLGGVARLGCSCGLVSQKHRVSGPVAISDIDGVQRPSVFHPGMPLLGNARLQLLCRGWMEHRCECA